MKKKAAENQPFPILVKFPSWLVAQLDDEADRLQVPRIAVIIQLLDEALRQRQGQTK